MTSTDGISIVSASTARSASGEIGYASILYTPYIDSYDWSLFDPTVHPGAIKKTEVKYLMLDIKNRHEYTRRQII